jgi:hypothetical protein
MQIGYELKPHQLFFYNLELERQILGGSAIWQELIKIIFKLLYITFIVPDT